MKILSETGLCFDDILIVPQYSDIHSRGEVDISTRVGLRRLDIPVISANMDTVTESGMANAMFSVGAMGILHRYMTDEKMASEIGRCDPQRAIPSVGVQAADYLRAEKYQNLGCLTICVDVAHGDSKRSHDMIKHCKARGLEVIAGNVCTREGTLRLVDAGADIIKTGVGPGSLCLSRIVTGHGVPQLSAIMECADAIRGIKNVYIIGDGGIRNSGDICKCLAAGADAVMIGGLFAGCLETPGGIRNGKKVYRGMASFSAQMDHDGRVHNCCPEGERMEVTVKGSVLDVIKELVGGIKSGLSYSGARDLKSFREKAVFVRVTPNCTKENGPHGKKE